MTSAFGPGRADEVASPGAKRCLWRTYASDDVRATTAELSPQLLGY